MKRQNKFLKSTAVALIVGMGLANNYYKKNMYAGSNTDKEISFTTLKDSASQFLRTNLYHISIEFLKQDFNLSLY